ncbi:MAG: hypothetical protein HONDAALG_02628 [Gammaproteobacteria bacterium]|nr:hypothetical protein [Gammaproteobacteria bacterium]
MSSNLSDGLQKWFVRFWEFVEWEKAAGNLPSEPLFRVRESWEHWWDTELSLDERGDIEQLASVLSKMEDGQKDFAHWVEEWIEAHLKWPGSGRLVLMQMAQMPLFDYWRGKEWESYREYANLIILSPEEGQWSIANIKPLSAVVILRDATDPPYKFINLKTSELPLDSSRRAALSALRGLALVIFLFYWAGLGWKHRPPWLRNMLCVGWALAGLGWATALTTPYFLSTTQVHEYFTDDRLLAPISWALIILPALPLLCVMILNLIEAQRAQAKAKEWAELLMRSQICLLIGRSSAGQTLEIKGPSFGVKLCVRILLALHRANPVSAEQSQLWYRFFDQLPKMLRNFSGTGEITGRGFIKWINRLEDKIAVSQAHPEITDMIAPVQRGAFLRRSGISRASSTESSLVGHASGSDQLRLHCYWHLAQVLAKLGGLVDGRTKARSTALALMLAIVLIALPGIWGILFPPLSPKLNYSECWWGNDTSPGSGGGDRLFLSFDTDSANDFKVKLNSEYWRNWENGLEQKPHHKGEILIPLKKHSDEQKDGDRFNGEIELVRQHRHFLFFPLPDTTVEEIPLSIWLPYQQK